MQASTDTARTPAKALIGFGQVRHTRLKPVRHAFRYPTFFLLLPMRQLSVVASQIATLATLSQGRFSLGVGVGGEWPREWQAAGRLAELGEVEECRKGYWLVAPLPQWRQKKVKALVAALVG